jgi:hypothetical protein
MMPSQPHTPATPPPDAPVTTDEEFRAHPAFRIVHPALVNAWTINKNTDVALTFDVINPVRQFKKGTSYNAAEPFPRYIPNPETDCNVTEVDVEGAMLQPYGTIPAQ